MAIQPFAGQPPHDLVEPYPVQQPIRPLVNTDGSTSIEISQGAAGALTLVTVNTSSTGNTVLVTATTAKTVKVYKVNIGVSNTASVITMQSGNGTAIGAPTLISPSTPMTLAFDGVPWYATTNSTDALVINVSTASNVLGSISVVQS